MEGIFITLFVKLLWFDLTSDQNGITVYNDGIFRRKEIQVKSKKTYFGHSSTFFLFDVTNFG